MKRIRENQKVTLTLKQLKRLVKESSSGEDDFEIEDGVLKKSHAISLIEQSGNDVVIPNWAKVIWYDAFHGIDDISSVTIPDSVTSIKNWAFSYCEFLENVKIGNGVTEILDCAFSHCPRLTSVTIGNSVQIIADNAFERCIRLPSITIPASVNEIGRYAFYGCRRLKEIHVATQAQKDMILNGKNELPKTTRIIVKDEDFDDDEIIVREADDEAKLNATYKAAVHDCAEKVLAAINALFEHYHAPFDSQSDKFKEAFNGVIKARHHAEALLVITSA